MSGLEEKYNEALSFEAQECNSTCGYPNKNAFVMLRSPSDKEMPWPGFFFGMCTASLWYVATDQVRERVYVLLPVPFTCKKIASFPIAGQINWFNS